MNERRAVYQAGSAAKTRIGDAVLNLAVWAGNGNHAELSVGEREVFGRRALHNLDAALAEMAEVREKLAAELDSA